MKTKTILILLTFLLFLNLCSCRTMQNLPEGDLIKTVISPSGKYKINAYLVNGGATVDFCVRGEVVEVNSGDKRNIYWEYRCQTADIEWIDDENVVINRRQLNILTDMYDFRDYL